jgi:hypothetical protein
LGTDAPAGYLSERRDDLFLAPAEGDRRQYAFAEWRAWNDKERVRLARRNPSFAFDGLGRDLTAVRDDHFKLVRTAGGAESLFDLRRDPGESRDVSDAFPSERARLSAQLDRAVSGWREWEEGGVALSKEDERELEARLSALGYI